MENLLKLHESLVSTGLEIHGIDSTGEISWKDGHPTGTDEADAQAVIDAHDPTDYDAVMRAQVLDSFQNNHLHGMTPDQIEAYVTDEIMSWGSLADARIGLLKLLPIMAQILSWLVIDQE